MGRATVAGGRPDHADGGAGRGDAAGRGRDRRGSDLGPGARCPVLRWRPIRLSACSIISSPPDFCDATSTGAYALTDAGQWLRDDHPQGVRASIDLEGAIGHADMCVVELLHTVRTGEPAFPRRFGRGFWEDLAEHPDRAASYHALMGRQLAAEAPVVAAAYDWSALGEVVDVGGGDGSLLIALLRAHPTLRGTVLDLAAPAAAAARALAAAGLADRGRARAGSFFEPLPAGAGGYILSRVIHDWDDDHARRILRNCAHAARPDGKVLVVEDTEDVSPPTPRWTCACSPTSTAVNEASTASPTSPTTPGSLPATVTPAGPLRSIIELLPDRHKPAENPEGRALASAVDPHADRCQARRLVLLGPQRRDVYARRRDVPERSRPRRRRHRDGAGGGRIGGTPTGLEGAKMLMLVDRETGKGLGITLFESEEAMRRGDEALNAMSPGSTERRTSVEFYEVPVQTATN